MANPHVDPYDEWSVSAAFCRFGSYRYNEMESRFLECLRVNLDSPHLYHEPRESQRERQRWRTDTVADCIRGLGYRVECGRYRCITWEDADASGDPRCGGAYRGSNYIILNITDSEGNLVYGNGPDRVSETDGYQSRAPNSSFTRDEENRDLCGHRTVFELGVNRAEAVKRMSGLYEVCDVEDPVAVSVAANNEMLAEPVGTVVLVERDADLKRLVKSVEPDVDIEVVDNYIRQGAVCYKKDDPDGWGGGVSTIGNTLPSDIVEALREFQPTLTMAAPSAAWNFYKDADYEFWIPEEMRESLACPCAEEVDVGVAGGAGGAVAPVSLTKGQSGDDDSSDDDESDGGSSDCSGRSDSESEKDDGGKRV